MSFLFLYDMEALIAQLKGCLLDCFGWELNCCVVHWWSHVDDVSLCASRNILLCIRWKLSV